jgi:ubiquinol-cytochrome c reductase cytochrome c subunit
MRSDAMRIPGIRSHLTWRRGFRWLAWLLLGPVVAAPGLAQLPEGDGVAGQDRYLQAGCAVCHGADGGGTPAGPSLAGGVLSQRDFMAFVRRPVRSMPAYPATAVSDAAVAEIYAYLARLPGPAFAGGAADAGARAFYASGCYECHANQAQGGLHGPRIGPNPISLPRFSWYVRHPSATMPPYSEQVLPDSVLGDIHAFLEALPQPPDPSRIPLLAP